jgi:hypothetical protein
VVSTVCTTDLITAELARLSGELCGDERPRAFALTAD